MGLGSGVECGKEGVLVCRPEFYKGAQWNGRGFLSDQRGRCLRGGKGKF